MATRRNHGEGGLFWDDSREAWVAQVYVGFTPSGKRKRRTFSSKNKTKAKAKLREMVRDIENGVPIAPHGYTVGEAVESWIAHELSQRAESTVTNRTLLAQKHLIPVLGSYKLRALTADNVDDWLRSKRTELSTDTMAKLLSILRRSINRAQARDKVSRNVALLCAVPKGRDGRPSKSLNFDQAKALLDAAEDSSLHAYIVLSLLTGARTEELRALTWSRVDLDGDTGTHPPVPPSIQVWRSVREGGDTKTKRSRRTLQLPERCVTVLRGHQVRQDEIRSEAGAKWQDHDLVFCTRFGTELDAGNVRRSFRLVADKAGLKASEWTPRELRHSFVSLLSHSGTPIEQISQLVGHASTVVTEIVYRQELRPVLTRGAEAMDALFEIDPETGAFDSPFDSQGDFRDVPQASENLEDTA